MKLPYRILALDDDEHALDGITELLRDGGYNVTPVSTYESAKQLVSSESYDLLVTDVHLRGFNGLHLVMQCRRACPEMAVMIMTGYEEPLIELEASRYNAEFMRKPIQPVEFLEGVARALSRVRRQRRWPRKRVVGGFRVKAHGHPAAVMDVSYGGLCLEMSTAMPLPDTFDVEVSGIGLRLEVAPVWASASNRGGSVVCGAALSSDQTPEARTWRTIVDRLTA
ncbi:MAG TPA: response regulator [Vicinamibacterales bacterium]|jgi:DNA-binding response OmpR family regulator|nr:response regulator [Vicinamibacterales bacterium]